MSSRHVLAALCFVSGLFHCGKAQSNATTDPTEVRALNTIFEKWGISSSMSKSPWNTTGDPCSDYALADWFDGVEFNPSILCDCSYNDNTTCHIIRLTAFKLKIKGTIPEELKYLSKLEKLKIPENYLNGPLPAFIGNFSAMRYLYIGENSLSGAIPREIGNLQNLILLDMGVNNFSGTLPPEIGNLTSLQQIYIDSIGVTGEIPSTFGKLQNVLSMWALDNNFGGKVPDFLGNLTKLKELWLQGNSFEGPIPWSFSKLTAMGELRLGGISNVSSSLAFIKNMKSLSILILRDCMISDTIPSDIGEFQSLLYMDLSFNNLRGELPASLFNMGTLQTLILGNNLISGKLPDQISASLSIIDLSYNQLYGSLPKWVGANNSNLKRRSLMANNFDFDDSKSGLPVGLRCLQRDVPCGRGSPKHFSFAINCGGNNTDLDGTHYEADNQELSMASYYVISTKLWAVSSTGTFYYDVNTTELDMSNFIQDTSNPKYLFQSARLSPSSLRYYGLGLENGNYTIKLQFVETSLDDSSWSRRRRVFDIYIQDNLVRKDFDIRMAAGGSFYRPFIIEYNASVTKNFLEIHLFWDGKGTCCIPTWGNYGPSISAISVLPNFKRTVNNLVNNLPSSNTSEKKKKVVDIAIGVAIFLFFVLISGVWMWRKRRSSTNQDEDEEILHGLTAKPRMFGYAELRTATDDFNHVNKLGEGGFGPVFKGKLPNEKFVAVKRLLVESIQGKEQFIAEVAIISTIKHRNLVKLYGCCYEGRHKLLVYEYLENGSLDRSLFGKNDVQLDWNARFMICLGTARGLAYLHEESRPRIIHRDIKSSNILLDSDLNPKISDFGLAKLYDDNMTHLSTRIAGTLGYLAPEYAMRGHLTEKVDVFGFGVVALEIISGRLNTDLSLDEEETYLLEWAWQLHEENEYLKMVDKKLPAYDEEQVARVIKVALHCTQGNPTLRPPMSRVVAMLIGDAVVDDGLSKPSYITDWSFDGWSTQASYENQYDLSTRNMTKVEEKSLVLSTKLSFE